MQIETGRRLGPYEIVERIGAGGMGEVYRARDTRLPRDVAIKVLPPAFARDATLRVRFDREAKAISSLSHPHICALHDVGNEAGIDYLVLEYCDGQTLAERLERGRLPLDEALHHGIDIADALSRAHRAGVVHRDLKPSNIMVTSNGVKLLDFGLAKQRADGGSPDATTSLHAVSESGTLLGTIQYMAPEVLGGAEADARSDIFALGLVLYEMIAGKPAFAGPSRAHVIASILEREPAPLGDVVPDAPPLLGNVIAKCLAKDPSARWESAHDIAEQLRWARSASAVAARPRDKRIATALTAAALTGLVAFAVWTLVQRAPAASVVRLDIAIPQPAGGMATVPFLTGQNNVAISPDGKRVAFVGGPSQIYVRSLEAGEAIRLTAGNGPFFSPDGRWVGFFRGGVLSKVSIDGGEPQVLFSDPRGSNRGATWAPDGTIYFAPGPGTGLWKVSSNGGDAREITRPATNAGENSHRWPQILPDGEHLLFTIRTDRLASFDDAKIAVLSVRAGTWRVLLEGGSFPRYVAPGHLIFARAGALYEVGFDATSHAVTGTPRKVVDRVVTSEWSGAADYDISSNGDLAYIGATPPRGESTILMTDSAGNPRSTFSLDVPTGAQRLSPSGRKVAMVLGRANDDIGVYDLDSGLMTRLSFEPGDEWSPVWTADEKAIIYSTSQPIRMVRRSADSSDEPIELARGNQPFAMSCSHDGALLLYGDHTPASGYDMFILPLKGGKPRPFLTTPFNEYAGRFSPDGRWVAYQSDESGKPQVYVRAASGRGGRWQVSTDGGGAPAWSPDGREVIYRRGFELLAVPVTFAEGGLQPARPRPMFRTPRSTWFDVAPDGFMLTTYPEAISSPRHVNVALNFRSELR